MGDGLPVRLLFEVFPVTWKKTGHNELLDSAKSHRRLSLLLLQLLYIVVVKKN
jgi:hypothetical protein